MQSGFYIDLDSDFDQFETFYARRSSKFGFMLEFNVYNNADFLSEWYKPTGFAVGTGTKVGKANYLGFSWNQFDNKDVITFGGLIRPSNFLSLGATFSANNMTFSA